MTVNLSLSQRQASFVYDVMETYQKQMTRLFEENNQKLGEQKEGDFSQADSRNNYHWGYMTAMAQVIKQSLVDAGANLEESHLAD